MRALCTFCLCSARHACMVCAPAILLPGHVHQLHRMHTRAPACAQAAPALQFGTATPAPSSALPQVCCPPPPLPHRAAGRAALPLPRLPPKQRAPGQRGRGRAARPQAGHCGGGDGGVQAAAPGGTAARQPVWSWVLGPLPESLCSKVTAPAPDNNIPTCCALQLGALNDHLLPHMSEEMGARHQQRRKAVGGGLQCGVPGGVCDAVHAPRQNAGARTRCLCLRVHHARPGRAEQCCHGGCCTHADEVMENKAHEPAIPVIIHTQRPPLMKGVCYQ